MLIRRTELEAIRAGRLDLAFRRWDRPRLRVGTRMRTSIGLVEATALDEVAPEAISHDEARRAGAASRDELLAGLARHPERPVFRIGLRFAGPDPRIALRERPDLSEEEHGQLVRRLDRLDQASHQGAWTRATLAIIDRRPATRAAELADELGRETPAFKRDVRKLKELGLTESLDTGYRLSPRGRALMQARERRLPTRVVEPFQRGNVVLMADDRDAGANLIGPLETAFRLELTAAQLKVTHTAVRALLDDFGHEERDVQAIVREVLDKLPDEHEIRAIDLGRELQRRRAALRERGQTRD